VAFKNDLAFVLQGCAPWEAFFATLVKDVEGQRPLAVMSVQIYNPADLVVTLAKAYAEGDYRYVPMFHAIESLAEDVTIYSGVLVWSGETLTISAKQFFSNVFGDLEKYMWVHATGGIYEYYDHACEVLGMRSLVFKLTNPGTQHAQVQVVGSEESVPNGGPPLSVKDFVEMNPDFGVLFLKQVRSMMFGLV
jgi:hypothetical protein